MELKPTNPETEQAPYVRNCLLSARAGEVLFTSDSNGTLIPTLDGYAIIPVEEYERLTGQQVKAG